MSENRCDTRRAATEPNTRSVHLEAGEAARSANSERPLDPHLDSTESEPDMSVATPDVTDRRTAALVLLAAHRDAVEQLQQTRLHLITLARQYGVTNAEIGEALGVTEGGVRMMLRRAVGA